MKLTKAQQYIVDTLAAAPNYTAPRHTKRFNLSSAGVLLQQGLVEATTPVTTTDHFGRTSTHNTTLTLTTEGLAARTPAE